ncbi:MAG: hypothetical protein H6999_10880 [Hahellaceae bacterium]|nr:hypothetical protein [Hahellaceae bacterium]
MLNGITLGMTEANFLSLAIVLLTVVVQLKMLSLVRQSASHALSLKHQVFQLISLLQSERLKKRSIKRSKDIMEKTVNDGTFAVEAVHQTIVGVTFDVIDALSGKDKVKENTRRLRVIHEQTAGGVYRSVREVNKQLSGLADSLLNTGKKASVRSTDDNQRGH